jgi:hypothetical protein|tara:strand:+ start:478 stop:1239 length:762 start_codon:yes stop_codon:yes gene_type:complete
LIDTLFPVYEIPVEYDVVGREKPVMSGYKLIVREDNNKVLSCMTDEYRTVTNKQVIDEVAKPLKSSGALFKEARMFGDGARTKWSWTFPKTKVDIGDGDVVNPEITIHNSYDGKWELSFMAGAFRLVCSNGLVIGTILDSKKNRHSIYNTNLDKIAELIMDTVNKTTDLFNEDFPMLQSTKVHDKSIPRVVEVLPQQAIEPFVRYCMGHDIKNYWDLLNAFTWVTSHALNREHESTHKLESKVYPLIKGMASA